ncbi:1-acyl-sn-glycerol-3-phosphate acyltransferase [Alteromonas sp. H39]|uniref:1-acyl-sn-glycerol-3-phosphate acyltransferase n=1 Tax=Alteromonas sp. H39 TaxID=3389876 RepID=UPI0039E10CBC
MKRIDESLVPDAMPRQGPAWLATIAAWGFRQRGWTASGKMVDAPKAILAVAPHTSNWDFFIGLFVLFALRLKVSFFGKHTIFIPPLGWLMRKLGGIPIERSRAHGMVEGISVSIEKQQKMVLALAPEGTRKGVYPWKTGFLHIARQATIPVQLIGLDYQRKQLVFGPVLRQIDDVSEQMQKIYTFYANVAGKYPENCFTSEFPRE